MLIITTAAIARVTTASIIITTVAELSNVPGFTGASVTGAVVGSAVGGFSCDGI